MCLIDDSSYNTEFSSRATRTARKAHVCDECGRTIARGETYRSAVGKSEGDFWTAKMCAHCQVAAQWLVNNCGGYLFHGVWEDFNEHVEANIPMIRLCVGARRRWKAFRGTGLMAVPVCPKDMTA